MSTKICKINAKIDENEQVNVQSIVIKGVRNQTVVLKFVKKTGNLQPFFVEMEKHR